MRTTPCGFKTRLHRRHSAFRQVTVKLLRIACFLVPLWATREVSAQDEPTPSSPYDFAIKRQFLEDLWAQRTFLPTYRIAMQHRSDIKSLPQDCEVHIAGELVDESFGDPPFLVVEPPNVCKFRPGATTPATSSTKAEWRSFLDARVIDKTCNVTGFPRIFSEHAVGGETGTSNPNHVFEIHPATTISCGAPEPLELAKFLRSFPELRHIQPASADDCIASARLWVRYHDEDGEDQYEFFEKRSPRCGNFAIVEVASVPREWIRKTNGGHTAIARVTADGGHRRTLKIYSIESTEADAWLERLLNEVELLTDPRLVHGIFTYDFFAMVRRLEQGGTFTRPTDWTPIEFPLAFVIFGPTDVVPWEEP